MSPSSVLLIFVVGLASAPPAEDVRATDWAVRIDQRLAARQQLLGITPAPLVDDATFLRRVSLDLIGRIPTVAETRAYLDDSSAEKHRNLVRRLIASPLFARHWAMVWRRAWIPQADTPQFSFLAIETERWLTEELLRHRPHDLIVQELLEVATPDDPSTAGKLHTPHAFLTAGEQKPENLAANSARAFLGLNLDCAQCHDHPFARWTRDEFWATAAFFTAPDESRSSGPLKIRIPETEFVVQARLLDDRSPAWAAPLRPESGRLLLSDWITARDNPYFARHAVNTVWAQLFGAGLVEPLDDLARDNPDGDPQHLQQLAAEAIEADLDLARLIEACVLTDAYRRDLSGLTTAATPAVSQEEERLSFAQMPLRAMTGEQLFDSLHTAAGLSVVREDLSRFESGIARREFAAKFRIERAENAARSVIQSLALMNGEVTSTAVDEASGPLLVAVAEGPFDSTAERVDILFLATYNRFPRAEERGLVVDYLEAGAPEKLRSRTADVFWSLINSAEFGTNH